MENSKRKNIYIVIFVITTIIAGALAVYFGIVANNKQQELDKQMASIKESESDKNVDNITGSNVQIKEVERIVEKAVIPKYDPSKMKNIPNGVTYSNNIGCYCDLNEYFPFIDSNGVAKISVHKDGNSKEITINGINEKVVDIISGPLGDGANYAFIFLTEKGDVYFSSWNGYGSLDIKPEKISSVSNIARVFGTMSNKTINGGNYTRATFIGIDINGNCYDLWYEYIGS